MIGIINQYQKDKAESDAKDKEPINYKDCNIIIRQGNLTEEREDAIAKVITKKGGLMVQKELEEYIKKCGNLPTGEATTTNAGDLPCEKVIHVVGPVYPKYNVRDQKQREELKYAIESILREMKKHKMNSVSFPVISKGISRFPFELCAIIIGDVLKKAVDKDPGFYNGEKLIICNLDNKTTNKMQEFIPD